MRAAKARPKQLRGEQLVAVVLEATLEEISTRGFEGLSIEEVAERAGVNKTTIYRRWPTREDLAKAALEQTADALVVRADTGSVRGDLLAFLRGFRDFATSARGQTIVRMCLAGPSSSSMARLARSVRDARQSVPEEILERAVSRGELPRGIEQRLIFDTLVGALQHGVAFGLRTDNRYLGQLVDLVLAGARAYPGHARVSRPATKSSGLSRSRRS